VWYQPVAGGLTVGIMGWFVPQLLGVGYAHVGAALNGGMALRLMILLLVLKLVAVATSYASGNAGGIFGPSLFLGAMLGGIVGNVAHGLFPNYAGTPGAYALVGMGTAFAGIVRAPMTSVVMIFEITRDYAVIVPLMISNLVSFFISARFQKQPIYEVLAQQDGIHLPSAETLQQLEPRQVVHAMREATEVLRAEMTVQEALERSKSSELRSWLVCDERGVIGVLRLEDLKREADDGLAGKRLREIVGGDDFPHVHADHPLHVALDRMGASQLDLLPVVNRANVHHLEGVVTLADVLALYGVDSKDNK
jgi:chloride channel protein, CIC family